MRLEDRKITILREYHRVKKVDMAAAMYIDVDKVYKVEKGQALYSDGQLDNLRKKFDIVGMPLSELECAVAKERLYYMRDLARDDRLEEAKAICTELANIVNLDPCDDDLPLLYRLLEVVVLFADGKDDVAAEKLDYLQGRLDDMNDEHLYYFKYNMGTLKIRQRDIEEGLEFCKQALEMHESGNKFLPEEVDRLHYSIALCFSYLQFPNRAIFYLLKARGSYNVRRTNILGLRLDIMLANNYVKVNELDEAGKLLDSCLVRAKSIKDDSCIGQTMDVFARLHVKNENWDEAIKCLDQALKYFKEGTFGYLAALYLKIHCIAGNRNYAKAKKLQEETRRLYRMDEVFAPYFRSLARYITVKGRVSIYNDEDVEYIEKVAIPNFEKNHGYFIAIEYYKLLEAYYVDKNNKKSLLMSQAIRKIEQRCFSHQY